MGLERGEKLHETLVTQEELSRAEDSEKFLCVKNYEDLDYDKYYSKGKNEDFPKEGYTSENTNQLSLVETKKLIESLPEIQNALKMKKINIGVTGYKGFIGYHLSTHIKYIDEKLNFIACPKNYFSDSEKLANFVSKCDVIIHLAAKNRGKNDEILSNNIFLVDQLITALKKCENKKYLIFASSTQESSGNEYGKSKIEGVKKFQQWATETNNKFTLKDTKCIWPFL